MRPLWPCIGRGPQGAKDGAIFHAPRGLAPAGGHGGAGYLQVPSSRVTIRWEAEEIPLADLRLVHGMLRMGGQVGVE